jgi:hypothetical protein
MRLRPEECVRVGVWKWTRTWLGSFSSVVSDVRLIIFRINKN